MPNRNFWEALDRLPSVPFACNASKCKFPRTCMEKGECHSDDDRPSELTVSVPEVPTNGMVYAGAVAYHDHKGSKFDKTVACWQAMLKEAQQ